MSDTNPELEALGRLAQARRNDENEELAPILRLARALTTETPLPEACAACRAEMPAMAQAELAGERLTRLFPTSYAHLDICEECALQYAELLDMLLEMEAAAGQSVGAAPPALPPRVTTALRIRNWVSALLRQMLDRFQLSADEVEGMVGSLVEILPRLPVTPTPLVSGQAALGFGGEDEETPLLLATWYAAEKLADVHTSDELEAMVREKKLARRAKDIAEETARQLGLSRSARKSFVEQFVASVEADPSRVVAMGRPAAP